MKGRPVSSVIIRHKNKTNGIRRSVVVRYGTSAVAREPTTERTVFPRRTVSGGRWEPPSERRPFGPFVMQLLPTRRTRAGDRPLHRRLEGRRRSLRGCFAGWDTCIIPGHDSFPPPLCFRTSCVFGRVVGVMVASFVTKTRIINTHIVSFVQIISSRIECVKEL